MGKEWLAASLATLALWGLWGVAAKRATELSAAWYQVYVTSNMAAIAATLAILAWKGWGALPERPAGLAWALASGAAGTLGYVFFVLALERGGSASVVVPLTALYPAVTALLARLVLGEELGPVKLAGIALAVAAVVLLSR